MAAKIPTKAAIDMANRLKAMASSLPSPRDDTLGYRAGLKEIGALITTEGGGFIDAWNGATIRLHGFRATSTMGLAGACHNWCTQVTLKAAAAAMDGAAA